MSESQTGYVYTLNDPRTGEPKYVGATQDPKTRLYGHEHGATSDKVKQWIDELEDEGQRPEMLVVEVTNLKELSKAEQQVISRLSQEWELLNSENAPPYTIKNTIEDYRNAPTRQNSNSKVTSQVTIDNPEMHAKKSVHSDGRIYLGREYANTDVRVTIEVLDDE